MTGDRAPQATGLSLRLPGTHSGAAARPSSSSENQTHTVRGSILFLIAKRKSPSVRLPWDGLERPAPWTLGDQWPPGVWGEEG